MIAIVSEIYAMHEELSIIDNRKICYIIAVDMLDNKVGSLKMFMGNRKRRLLVIMVLFLTSGIILGTLDQNRKSKNDFKKFNSSNLSGRVSYMDKFSRGVRFALNNSSTKYTFYPLNDKGCSEVTGFKSIVKEGDSILKAPFSDTLFLIKHNRIYRFTFIKYQAGK